MGSEVGFVGARVSDNDCDVRQSDVVSGTCGAYGSFSSRKKQDTELFRDGYFVSSSMKEDSFRGQDHGMTNGAITLISGSEGKSQRKVEKVPKYISGSFKKLRMVQTDTVLPPAENDDSNMELDMLGSHFVKCSNADKSQVVKQRNTANGKRGDRRNSKAPMKAKFDPFALKAGLPSFRPAAGGSNAFGMYGLKPDVHDVTKLMVDISLDELLDGTYQCPTFGKDKEKRTANVNDNVIDSVRKVCSLIFRQGAQQSKQTEEDVHAIKETSSSSSPSNTSVENGGIGDGSTSAGLSECSKDLDASVKGEVSADLNSSPLYQPRDILEKLALPPPKDLESLLQDAVKPANKQVSHRVSLPPFPWSHYLNGHYKSNTDALKTSSKSTCFGRWVRISNSASFIQRGVEGFVDLDSLAYDDSLVPAGQLRYKLPVVEKTSTTSISQHFRQRDVPPVSCPPAPLPPPGETLPSPKVLLAARTLYGMASCSYAMASSAKHNSIGLPKWPQRQSQKAMKARKSRLNEIPEEGFWAPKSDTIPGHLGRSVEYVSSSKKPKISRVDRREESSHVEAVIGLCSVSAPRSNRPSPNILSRDSISEAKHLNGSLAKSSFMGPPPPMVVDRSHWTNQNPQKSRKITPMDRNRTKS